MTDIERIVNRMKDAAKTVVTNSATVVGDESTKIDSDDYQVSDAINTVTKLFNVGLTGLTDLGRIALEERPEATTLALGEYVGSVVQRMVSQTGSVAQAASVQLVNNKYGPNEWLKSMTQMIDIAIMGGIEIAETIAAGPAQFERPPVRSDEFEAQDFGELSIAKPLKRDATDEVVPADRVTFDPPALTSPNKKFHLLVDPNGRTSGVYRGTVKAGATGRELSVHIAL
jgi:hypothetical protein